MNRKKARKPFPFHCAPVQDTEEDFDLFCRCLFCRQNTLGPSGGLLDVRPFCFGPYPVFGRSRIIYFSVFLLLSHGPLRIKDHSALTCQGGILFSHGPRRADHLLREVVNICSQGTHPVSGGTLDLFKGRVWKPFEELGCGAETTPKN